LFDGFPIAYELPKRHLSFWVEIMNPPTYADVLAAAPVVRRYMKPTPLYEWLELSRLLGCRYFLKHENHAPTTAFKVRGGIYLLSRLPDEQRRRGIIGCTTGNHGQSLAYASRLFGVRCVLVVPCDANPDKVAAMRTLGAEIVEHGSDFDEARAHCEQICHREGLRYVHSANEPDLIAGVGSYALEIFDDLPEPDVVLVPVGLGSGICGAALAAFGRRPQTQTIGVQSELAPAMTLSWREGRPVECARPTTFAEGMATRVPASMTLEIMGRLVHDMVLVSDDELRRAVHVLLKITHNLAEGAGAAATAAAWRLRQQLAGKTVVGVLSGGNLDLRELDRILATKAELGGGHPS
jgi:threonine dehydratase